MAEQGFEQLDFYYGLFPGDPRPARVIPVEERTICLVPEFDTEVRHAYGDFTDLFVSPFGPELTFGEIDPVKAIMAAVQLHNSRYRVQKGMSVSIGSMSRTVASVLMELGVGLPVKGNTENSLEELRSLGAKIGPYFLVGPEPDNEPLFYAGVGLWMPLEAVVQ